MHHSVFEREAIDALGVLPGERYIDATYGQGGHTREIERRGGIVLAIDADPEQVRKSDSARIVHGNFRDIAALANAESFSPVRGILFDFGLSMEQLAQSKRGFSFMNLDESLDMRLDPERQDISAQAYLQNTSVDQLADDFARYAEDEYVRDVAKAVVRMRTRSPIHSVEDFRACIDVGCRIRPGQDASSHYGRYFQAVRMVVNQEDRVITEGLIGACSLLQTGGKIVTITFHSVEDRWVKRFFQRHSAMFRHHALPVGRSRKLARYERSAVLRVAEMI